MVPWILFPQTPHRVYDSGSEETIVAVAEPGYYFATWKGNVADGHKRVSPLITMNGDKVSGGYF